MTDHQDTPSPPDDLIVIGPDRIEGTSAVSTDPTGQTMVVSPDAIRQTPAQAADAGGEAGPDEVVVVPEETPPKRPPTQSSLRRDRRQLWDEREATVYHVGGLAIDLRRRGIEDVELINRRADVVLDIDRRIADIDASLVDIDARRRTKTPPIAGYCLSCGAPYQTEAAFCFRCGSRVLPPDPIEVSATETPTTVIDVDAERS